MSNVLIKSNLQLKRKHNLYIFQTTQIWNYTFLEQDRIQKKVQKSQIPLSLDSSERGSKEMEENWNPYKIEIQWFNSCLGKGRKRKKLFHFTNRIPTGHDPESFERSTGKATELRPNLNHGAPVCLACWGQCNATVVVDVWKRRFRSFNNQMCLSKTRGPYLLHIYRWNN